MADLGNMNDLNNALGFDPNKQDKDQKKKLIITIVSVLVIGLILILIILMINSNQKPTVIVVEGNTYNEVVPNYIYQEVSQDMIIDDETQEMNRNNGLIDIVWIDKENRMIDIPLKPEIGDLTPIKYDSTVANFVTVDPKDPSWYDYSKNMWANSMNSDGSYFVWIPRYAYKITYYADRNYTRVIGYADSRGVLKIDDSNTSSQGQRLIRIEKNSSALETVGDHYIVHPAFMRDAINNYENGGWDIGISGFWVSKYEAGMESDGVNVDTNTAQIGDVKVSQNIKAVSKPTIKPWRNISIGNAYYNGLNYDKAKQSHILKNSEWSAVTYLADSIYGRNGTLINSNSEFTTGGSNNLTVVYFQNGGQSSTNNVTGVFDLAGGVSEATAAYINNGFSALAQYGGTEEDMLCSTDKSSKFKTIYKHSNMDQGTNNYKSEIVLANYELCNNRRGDAIFETSNSGVGNSSWFNNFSYFMAEDVPFIARGGDVLAMDGSGIFSYVASIGQATESIGFRIALVIQ